MLEPKDKHLLSEISRFIVEHHMPPTLRELRPFLQTKTTSVVNYHLRTLEVRGLIRRIPNVARGIIITPAGEQLLARVGMK